jgi:hypothetical protein
MEKVTRTGSSTHVETAPTYAYPTEIIDLPSGGKLYETNHPLASGTIEIKYMTAREEDILTSQNLINKGIVLDKLFESIIVSDVSVDDIIVGDKNAIMLASRIMAYGPDYHAKLRCPQCDTVSTEVIDLTLLENKEVEISEKNGNSFGLHLPQSGKEITFKILTHGDSRKIDEEIETWDRINKDDNAVRSEMSVRYKFVISSVDGETSKVKIKEFIKNGLTIQDSRLLKRRMKELSPGIDQTFEYRCGRCDFAERIKIPFGIDFFWTTE